MSHIFNSKFYLKLEVYIHEDNYSWRCEILFSLLYRSICIYKQRSIYLRVRWTVDENENRKIKISNTVPLSRDLVFREVPIDSEQCQFFYTQREREREREEKKRIFPIKFIPHNISIYFRSLSFTIVFLPLMLYFYQF